MGFTPKKTIYRLDFEGTDLDGAEVRMRASSLGLAFDVVGLIGVDEDNATPEDIERALQQYVELADHLVSWNLDDDNGDPLPADLEGLKTLEIRYVRMIAEAWQRAQVDVPGPLPSGLSNGQQPPDLLGIPMATIPASLAS